MRPAGPRKVIGPWSDPRTGRSPCGRCDSAQLALQQIHQQAVMPRTVGAALVLAHDADRTEPDALVAADRDGVVRGRIDRDPVMAAVVEEPSCDGPNRLGSKASPVSVRAQR